MLGDIVFDPPCMFQRSMMDMILIVPWLLVLASFDHVQSFSVPPSVASVATKPWKFRGHDVFCQVSESKQQQRQSSKKQKPDVILIHGFGCSTLYWRETVASLTEAGFPVHALDLLGQGLSAKPGRTDGIEYSTALWAQSIDAYARENIPDKNNIVLVGNSVGSLVALAAATGYFDDEASTSECYIRQRIAGIGMFNCGIGLNTRNIVKDPKWNAVQRYLLNLTFDFLESFIFGNVGLLAWFLDKVVTRELLRKTVTGLYSCADNPEEKVDDDLVDSFYVPAKQAGSAEVLCQILTNDPGLSPIELHSDHEGFLKNVPIHVVWGDEDTVTPLQWQVGQFYSALAADKREDNPVSLEVIHSGHIPFDEVPDIANGSMLKWLNEKIVGVGDGMTTRT